MAAAGRTLVIMRRTHLLSSVDSRRLVERPRRDFPVSASPCVQVGDLLIEITHTAMLPTCLSMTVRLELRGRQSNQSPACSSPSALSASHHGARPACCPGQHARIAAERLFGPPASRNRSTRTNNNTVVDDDNNIATASLFHPLRTTFLREISWRGRWPKRISAGGRSHYYCCMGTALMTDIAQLALGRGEQRGRRAARDGMATSGGPFARRIHWQPRLQQQKLGGGDPRSRSHTRSGALDALKSSSRSPGAAA